MEGLPGPFFLTVLRRMATAEITFVVIVNGNCV